MAGELRAPSSFFTIAAFEEVGEATESDMLRALSSWSSAGTGVDEEPPNGFLRPVPLTGASLPFDPFV